MRCYIVVVVLIASVILVVIVIIVILALLLLYYFGRAYDCIKMHTNIDRIILNKDPDYVKITRVCELE